MVFAMLSMAAFAQQIPNGSFEMWSDPDFPDYWGTWADAQGISPFTFPYYAVKDTSTYADGHTSLKMITDTLYASIGGQITSSLAGLGTMVFNPANNQVSFPGISYNKRPNKLYCSFRYQPANPRDTGMVFIDLIQSGNSLFGGLLGAKVHDTHGFWISDSFDLSGQYTSGNMPDTLILFFQSSTDTAAADTIFHSTLWVDAVHFDASVNVGIVPLSGEVHGVNAWPNPATDKISIAIEAAEKGSSIQLFDAEGREVYRSVVQAPNFDIDTHDFPAGLYSIRVNSTDGLTTYKGKIEVTR